MHKPRRQQQQQQQQQHDQHQHQPLSVNSMDQGRIKRWLRGPLLLAHGGEVHEGVVHGVVPPDDAAVAVHVVAAVDYGALEDVVGDVVDNGTEADGTSESVWSRRQHGQRHEEHQSQLLREHEKHHHLVEQHHPPQQHEPNMRGRLMRMWCMMLIQAVILLCCCSSWQWWWSAQPPDHHHCQLEQPQRSSITSSNIMGHIHIDRWLHAADTLRAFSFHFTVTGEQGGISVECQATKQRPSQTRRNLRSQASKFCGHRGGSARQGSPGSVRDRQGSSTAFPPGIVRDLQPKLDYYCFLHSFRVFAVVSASISTGIRAKRRFSRRPPVFEKTARFRENHQFLPKPPVFEPNARFRENRPFSGKLPRFRKNPAFSRFRVFAPKPATSPWPRHTSRLH